MNRRMFIGAGLAGAAAAAADAKPLRIGMVGTGQRGTVLLECLLKVGGVAVPAVCDIDEARAARAQGIVQKAGQPRPESYTRGETDFRRLCDRRDLDLVISATPWQWHAPAAVYAMKSGKHAASEVPVALTVDECWELVETSEKTGRQCIMLENNCYKRETLLVLNIIRAGLLGDIRYAEGGYLHDLRAVKFNLAPASEPWRLDHAVHRNGNLYPTHGVGPMAWWMDINRGDRLTYMVSMSSKARGLHEFALAKFGAEDPRSKTNYILGDMNVSVIRTELGKTMTVLFDTNTARPKEINVRVQGTRGTYSSMMQRIFIDGRSPGERWEALDEYKRLYDPRLWKGIADTDQPDGGHRDADEKQAYRLVKNFREGKPHDMDVYDAVTWSAISPLSEASVGKRGTPMDFPDFTRGKWKNKPPVGRDEIS